MNCRCLLQCILRLSVRVFEELYHKNIRWSGICFSMTGFVSKKGSICFHLKVPFDSTWNYRITLSNGARIAAWTILIMRLKCFLQISFGHLYIYIYDFENFRAYFSNSHTNSYKISQRFDCRVARWVPYVIETQSKTNYFNKLIPVLTYWGRVTHLCVGNLTIIGPDNGLSPGRRQAIIWTNTWILLIGPWGTNFNEIWIGIH